MTNGPSQSPPRAPIVRGAGETPSERYLARLAERSFLNLWCYPNVYIEKKQRGVGDGKELCDLLVVCGDHMLIFGDKTVAWQHDNDVLLAWRRWYKRAIAKSVDQIRGAERWIAQYPDRIFTDRACTQRLPLPLPPPDRRKVHGIVVALGAGEASKRHFGQGIGSLTIVPRIKGSAHSEGDNIAPLAIGDVDPDGSFVHVLDDATLDIVLRELDTIEDLTAYLTKKEALIRSDQLIAAGGEEDLVAYYTTHMSKNGEHDFAKPDGSLLGEGEAIVFEPGIYDELLKNPQYIAKKEADKVSYLWDRLIETFTTHILAGTSIVPEGQSSETSELEAAIRHMAVVPRYRRRLMAAGIADALEKGRSGGRFTRGFLPGPTERDQGTGFFFMTLARPAADLGVGYQQYRTARVNVLQAFGLALLQRTPTLRRVVGIATEPPTKEAKDGSSEDLLVIEDIVWTDQLKKDLAERMKALNIMADGNFEQYAATGNEYPVVATRRTRPQHADGGMSRKERRRLDAEARRRRRKGR